MSLRILAGLILLITSMDCYAQKSIDLSMEYPPNSFNFRKYSVYEPAGFDPADPNILMIGFHPYNPGTWDGKTWRDTLKSFSELVDVLLVCPDGGSNGRIDDADDYAFINALIDTLQTFYTIDPEKVYSIGFSVGGKAVYEYSFDHVDQMKGMIVIGAAIDGVDFSDKIHKSRCRPYYQVHGEKDSPNVRYYPIKSDLQFNKALVDGILMANIGHTINFPNRNAILKRAFNFIDTSSCDFTGIEEVQEFKVKISPNPVGRNREVTLSSSETLLEVEVYSSEGKRIAQYIPVQNLKTFSMTTKNFPAGLILIRVKLTGGEVLKRLVLE